MNYKHYYNLVILSIVFAIICIPTGSKIIDFGNTPLSISIFYFPIVYIISDLITEVYGYSLARRAIWYSIICQIVTVIIFQFVALYPPSEKMNNNSSYLDILNQAPIMVIVGTIATFIGDITNNFILSKLKIMTNGTKMWLRFVLSTVGGEFINTLIFYFFALILTGLIPFSDGIQSILLATIIKTIVEILCLPLSIPLAIKLKQIENIDTFDTNTDFNPLKF